jgi:DNA repair exonuclease SbcCD ATPase subunit
LIIKLLELRLNNFMGGTETIRPNGENISVYGDNRCGKTRLATAYQWLFTGKNTVNSADFEVKNLDANNNPVHGLDHLVEAIFDIDGKTVSFMRLWKENWVKKRGTNEAEFKGHSTEFFIDGVPLAEKEFNARIESYFPFQWFQILTNPLYFIQYLKGDSKKQDWKIRREILVSLFGDITAEEIIAANPSLSGIPAILAGKNEDDTKKVIKASMTKTNQELEGIRYRIDENNRTIQGLDLTGLNLTALATERDATQRVINQKGQEIEKIKNGGAVAEKQNELKGIELDLQLLENQWNENIEGRLMPKKKQLSELNNQIDQQNQEITLKQSAIRTKENQVKSLESEKKSLTEEWYAYKTARESNQASLDQLNQKEFKFEPSGVCPACGSTPENQPNFSEEKALEVFNTKKAQDLQEIQSNILKRQIAMDNITSEGKKLREDIEKIQGEIQALQTEIQTIQFEMNGFESQKKILEEQITDEREKKIDTAEYKSKLEAKSKLKSEITQLQTDTAPTIQSIEDELVKLRLALQDTNANIAKFDTKKTAEDRIKELSDQEKKLAAEYEKLQGQLFMIEEFTRLKISSLEDKINSQFEIVRWKMFNQQINGGIEEICDAMVGGVTITGLNTEARVNAGLDVIRAFSRKLNLCLPVFVDNAEGVTQLLPVESQVIRLVKPEIETEEDRRKYSKLVIKI